MDERENPTPPEIEIGDIVLPAADMPERGLRSWNMGIVQGVTESGAYEVGFAVDGASAPVFATLEASELLAMRSPEDVVARVLERMKSQNPPAANDSDAGPTTWGGNELLDAVWADDCGKVAQLLASGTRIADCLRDDGENALHFADNGSVEMIETLLRYSTKSDINAVGIWGLTPLGRAVLSGRLDIAELLLAHGADINTIEGDGIPNTPLRQVADKAPLHVLKFLVEHGADWDVPGWMQLTARDVAEERIAGERPLDPDIALDEAAEAEVRAWLIEELASKPWRNYFES